MDKAQERERLLLQLMHLIAEKFKDEAILKGGMYLRLLNSPRYTQDIDYIFRSKASRRLILDELIKLMGHLEGVKVTNSQLNSRGIIVEMQWADNRALLEVSVKETPGLPPEQMTTLALASRYQMSGRVITVLALAEAYSHKIAAALERVSLRDLYDITIYQPLTPFDLPTLLKRFSAISIGRQKPAALGLKEADALLKKRVGLLDQKMLEDELFGLVPDNFLKGGLTIIKNCINRLGDELVHVDKSISRHVVS